jgi:hypothetical protein
MPPACTDYAEKFSSVPAGIARLGKMANAAENTHLGTVIDMESYRTLSPAPTADRTPKPIPSGPAGNVTEPSVTPDRSGVLSADERWKLAKIRRNRNQGWMPTFEEFDFLLSIAERVNQ